MKLIRVAVALFVSGFFLAETASPAEPAAPEHTGLAVGEKAPSFTLKDQANHDVSLDSLLKKGPLALVFFRSVDW
jgi:cytochrome oxidase Cu insertion factor (SCO1/SenC/PrrC family)